MVRYFMQLPGTEDGAGVGSSDLMAENTDNLYE